MRRLIAVLLPALLLAACIDGEETTWLERDGSGRLEAVYRMPPAVMAELGGPETLARTLAEGAARDPHVDLDRITHRTEKGRVVFEFAGTFDDLRNLCSFPQRQLRDPAKPDEPVDAEALFGETDLAIGPRGIAVHRTIDISGVLPRSFKVAPALLGDSSFRYILHLPVNAKATNAEEISGDGRTLTWTFLLKNHATEPMILTAEAPLPIPAWVWLAALAFLLALAALLSLLVKRRRKSAARSL